MANTPRDAAAGRAPSRRPGRRPPGRRPAARRCRSRPPDDGLASARHRIRPAAGSAAREAACSAGPASARRSSFSRRSCRRRSENAFVPFLRPNRIRRKRSADRADRLPSIATLAASSDDWPRKDAGPVDVKGQVPADRRTGRDDGRLGHRVWPPLAPEVVLSLVENHRSATPSGTGQNRPNRSGGKPIGGKSREHNLIRLSDRGVRRVGES